jgi:hypothetical protein
MTTTSTGAQERTQAVASSAADEGKHVAGVAKEEAQNVASEAISQARSVVGDALQNATGQVNEQTRTQRDRLTGTLRTLGEDLDKMASQADSGLAGDLAREAAQRAHSISQHLDGREPGELLDDVRRFARQRPGTFLLGALGAGVVAGRLLRGTKDGIAGAAATSSSSSTPGLQGGADLATGTSTGTGGLAHNLSDTPTPSGSVSPAAPPTPGTQPGRVDPVASTPATRAGVTSGVGFEDGGDLLGGERR